MSTVTNWKHWVLRYERALVSIAEHPARGLRAAERIYDVPAGELQQFLDAHNGGRAVLELATIARVKVELGIIAQGKASEVATAAPAPRQAPLLLGRGTKPHAGHEGPSVWLTRPRRPRTDAIKKYRPKLEKLVAGGQRTDSDFSWCAFLRTWFGTRDPVPAMVQAFLAWVDSPDGHAERPAAKDSAPNSAEPKAPATEHRPRVPVVKLDSLVNVQKKLTQAAARQAVAPGWRELEILRGKCADYAVRYSGAESKNPALSLAARFVKSNHVLEVGTRLRVYFHAGTGQLRLQVGDGEGLKVHASRGGLRMTSRALPGLLGQDARNWCMPAAQVEDPQDFTLEPVEKPKGGAS